MSPLQFHRIRITDRSIEECEGRIAVVTVPRADVSSMRVVEAVISEHPQFMFLIGLACVAAGVLGVGMFVGGASRIGAGLAVFAAFAPLAFAAAFRRGPVLLVRTQQIIRKLGFGKGVTFDAIRDFVNTASERGVVIEMDLPVAITARRRTRSRG